MLNFQTVFEIVVAIEGLSIWQGRHLDGRREFTTLDKPEVDIARHEALCDEVRGHPENFIASLKVPWASICFFAKKAGRWFVRFVTSIPYLLYRGLAWLLKISPFVTIPALAVCYLRQWDCSKDDCGFGSVVFWFIVGKCVAYLYCLASGRRYAEKKKVSTESVGPDAIDMA